MNNLPKNNKIILHETYDILLQYMYDNNIPDKIVWNIISWAFWRVQILESWSKSSTIVQYNALSIYTFLNFLSFGLEKNPITCFFVMKSDDNLFPGFHYNWLKINWIFKCLKISGANVLWSILYMVFMNRKKTEYCV